MDQRVSLITLGVTDLGRAKSFYQAMGWRPAGEVADDVVFFQAGGMVVALWDRAKLAGDSAVQDTGGWGGVTLAYNVSSEPAKTFWGGYSGVFIDPDGHPWEVAHNPGWTVHADGTIGIDG